MIETHLDLKAEVSQVVSSESEHHLDKLKIFVLQTRDFIADFGGFLFDVFGMVVDLVYNSEIQF